MNYDIEREWFERRAAQEADLEIGAGRRLTQTIHLTPEEIEVLEKLVNPTAAALRAEIEALRVENVELLAALKDMLPPKLTWKERDADGFLVHHKVAAINAARAAVAKGEARATLQQQEEGNV